MKSRVTITGIESLQRKLSRFQTEFPREVEAIVKTTATILCREYARATGPGKSLSEAPIISYQKFVEAQTRRIFPSSDRPYAVYEIIKRRSPQLASGYLRAVRQNKPAQARRYLADAGVRVESIDTAAHKAARTGAGASVPKSAEPIAVVNSSRLRVYIRELKSRVGMAKASWYQAGLGISKRLRTQVKMADGSRKTFQAFPPSIRKVARKFPGLGGSSVTGSGMDITVVIFSNVSHGPEALDVANYALANTQASGVLSKSISIRLAAFNARLFG